MNIEQARAKRLAAWRQDGQRNLPDSASAVQMIDEMGLVTLYGASPEFPSLLLAHVGTPNYIAEASWDSPAGFVYEWRWDLGKTRSAFYSTIVAKKPTWVSWKLLPTVLAAVMNRTPAKELYNSGELSRDAWKVYEALDASDEPLTTKQLRITAGFPTGKENRAAYLKAVEELETYLYLAKVFAPASEADEMSHGLVAKLYPEAWKEAYGTDLHAAVEKLVLNHAEHSAYIDGTIFARHLRLQAALVNDLLKNHPRLAPIEGAKNCYALKENS
ncbi:MAG TPA: hypothetical protein VG944_23030 [Fimbriimonas sp.]|nr:hypothetical protein [Fimbriimonas sp.]